MLKSRRAIGRLRIRQPIPAVPSASLKPQPCSRCPLQIGSAVKSGGICFTLRRQFGNRMRSQFGRATASGILEDSTLKKTPLAGENEQGIRWNTTPTASLPTAPFSQRYSDLTFHLHSVQNFISCVFASESLPHCLLGRYRIHHIVLWNDIPLKRAQNETVATRLY